MAINLLQSLIFITSLRQNSKTLKQDQSILWLKYTFLTHYFPVQWCVFAPNLQNVIKAFCYFISVTERINILYALFYLFKSLKSQPCSLISTYFAHWNFWHFKHSKWRLLWKEKFFFMRLLDREILRKADFLFFYIQLFEEKGIKLSVY